MYMHCNNGSAGIFIDIIEYYSIENVIICHGCAVSN